MNDTSKAEPTKEKRLVLEVVGGGREVIELPRQGALTLGSAASKADVALEGRDVADVHCAIGRIKGGGWALKDLGSDSGTLVNGERVQQRRLEEGDVLTLGTRRLRVIDPERVPATAAEAPAPKAAPKPAPVVVEPNVLRPPISATQVAAQTLPQVRGYRLERALGRGAMGEVYLAVQESLDRRVALKVLSSKLSADADFVRRFQFEARAAAALNHPNVVTVHDVWEESGRHFLAMEYMDKGNLETRVAREGRIPPKEALEILSDMAKALVYAELRGIVHRDIKPANLMQNSAGTNKLADLGLATHLEAEATEADNKKIFGTPHFISPEQARGEKVDGRSDLYSLGATMYRLLSGRTPFEGATTRDILRGHFFDTPKRLSELARDVPPELETIVHRLLEKKPEARYASAGGLLQEVERLKSAAVHAAATAAPAGKSKIGMWLGLAGAAAAAIAISTFFFGGDDKPTTTPDAGAASTSRVNPRLPSNTGKPANPDDAATPTDPGRADATAQPGKPGDAPRRPRDSDAELKLRELEAENAYMKLPADLPLAARRDELIRLSQQFDGTNAAGRFTEEIAKLATEIERDASALTERESTRKQALDFLQRAGLAGDAPLPLAQALSAMLAQPMPIELASDPVYLAQRRQVLLDVARGALERGRAALARADELQRTGKFESVPGELTPWIAAFTLPDTTSEPGLRDAPEFKELEVLKAHMSQRVDGLEAAKLEFSTRVLSSDGALLSTGLRGAGGVEQRLRALELERAVERLTALEGELQSEEARLFTRTLRDELQAGKRSLDVLTAAFAQGAWRRKGIADPRSKTRATRDTLGVGPAGLEVKVDAATETVPWSAFGAKPNELNQLFDKRLTREWTREELVGIEALLRTAAVLQAVDEAAEMFVGDAQSVFSEEEARALTEGFDVARNWSQMVGQTATLEREAAAAKVLADALRAASDGAWTVCVSALERLSSEFRGTLLVRCLSDGSVNLPPSEPPESKPSNGEAADVDDKDGKQDKDGKR